MIGDRSKLERTGEIAKTLSPCNQRVWRGLERWSDCIYTYMRACAAAHMRIKNLSLHLSTSLQRELKQWVSAGDIWNDLQIWRHRPTFWLVQVKIVGRWPVRQSPVAGSFADGPLPGLGTVQLSLPLAVRGDPEKLPVRPPKKLGCQVARVATLLHVQGACILQVPSPGGARVLPCR